MNRKIRQASLISFLVFATASLFAQGKPTEKFVSPAGDYSVQIVQKPMPGADPDFDFFTLTLSKKKKAIAKVPTYGYLTAAHWSPDGKYVALNNRRGNAGDYVWVFQLSDGRLVKGPGDSTGEGWQKAADAAFEKNFPAANGDNFLRSWVTARGWKEDGQLQFVVRSIYRNAEGAFDFEALADPDGWSITSSKVSKSK